MDNRTKREKLEAMAKQTASPQEAEIAKKKLAELGPEPYTPPDGTMHQNNDPFSDVVFTFWFNGKPHHITRKDIYGNPAYQPSGWATSGFYGTVSYTATSYAGTRPNFNFRKTTK